jgi:hypothetical protein
MYPEKEVREVIDGLLEAAGWQIQDYRDANLGAGRGVAVHRLLVKTWAEGRTQVQGLHPAAGVHQLAVWSRDTF